MFLLMSNKCYYYLVWKPDTTVCIRKCCFFGTMGGQVDVLIYGYIYICSLKSLLVSSLDEKNIDNFIGIVVDK